MNPLIGANSKWKYLLLQTIVNVICDDPKPICGISEPKYDIFEKHIFFHEPRF